MNTNTGENSLMISQTALRMAFAMVDNLARNGSLSEQDIASIQAFTMSGVDASPDGKYLMNHLKVNFDEARKCVPRS